MHQLSVPVQKIQLGTAHVVGHRPFPRLDQRRRSEVHRLAPHLCPRWAQNAEIRVRQHHQVLSQCREVILRGRLVGVYHLLPVRLIAIAEIAAQSVKAGTVPIGRHQHHRQYQCQHQAKEQDAP